MKRIAREGTLKPHDVRVPGVLVDYIVVDPDQKQTTQTLYDPAISGEIFRPLDTFRLPEFNIQRRLRAVSRRNCRRAVRSIWVLAFPPMYRAFCWKRACMVR